jgi:hypothetical protein
VSVCDGEGRREKGDGGEGLVCGREGEEKKNERVRRKEKGTCVGEREKSRAVQKRKGKRKMKGKDKVAMCHLVSGWEEIVKFTTANWVATRGKWRLPLFF